MRFTRPVGVVGIRYHIEASTDLRTWRGADVEFERVANPLAGAGNEDVTFLQRPGFDGGFRFVRVRAEIE